MDKINSPKPPAIKENISSDEDMSLLNKALRNGANIQDAENDLSVVYLISKLNETSISSIQEVEIAPMENAIEGHQLGIEDEPQKPPLNIEKINDDCLQHIFGNLNIRDLTSVAETSTRFYSLAQEAFTRKHGQQFVMDYNVGARTLRAFGDSIRNIRVNTWIFYDSRTNSRRFREDDLREKLKLVHKYCTKLSVPMTPVIQLHNMEIDSPMTEDQYYFFNEFEESPHFTRLSQWHDWVVIEVDIELRASMQVNDNMRAIYDNMAMTRKADKNNTAMDLMANVNLWNKLSDKLVETVFEYFHPNDLAALAETCTRFRRITRDIFQRRFARFFVYNQGIKTITLRVFGDLIEVMSLESPIYWKKSCCENEQWQMIRLAHRYCKNVRVLRLENTHLMAFNGEYLPNMFKNLTDLMIKIHSFKHPNQYIERRINTTLMNCENLVSLNISFFGSLDTVILDPILRIKFPKLRTLSMWGVIASADVFTSFCRQHHFLRTINLTLGGTEVNKVDLSSILYIRSLNKLWIRSDFTKPKNNFIALIRGLNKIPLLRYLHLCGFATDSQIHAICRLRLKRLVYLQMPGMNLIISDPGFWLSHLQMIARNMPNLIEFRMPYFDWFDNSRASTKVVLTAVIHFVRNLQKLKTLCFSGGLLVDDNIYERLVRVVQSRSNQRKLELFGFGIKISINLSNHYCNFVKLSKPMKYVHNGFDN